MRNKSFLITSLIVVVIIALGLTAEVVITSDIVTEQKSDYIQRQYDVIGRGILIGICFIYVVQVVMILIKLNRENDSL